MVTPSVGTLQVRRLANTGTGTMDLQYKVEEGQPSYIEKIEIRGNVKTKNRVIRRELAVSRASSSTCPRESQQTTARRPAVL